MIPGPPHESLDRLREPEPRSGAHLRALTAACRAVVSARDPAQAVTAIAEAARSLLGAEVAAATVLRGADWSGALHAVASAAGPRASDQGTLPDASAELCERVRRSGGMLHLTGARPGADAPSGSAAPAREGLAALLTGHDGRVLGLVRVAARQDGRAFDEADEAGLGQLALVAGAAVERAQADAAREDGEARMRLIADHVPALVSYVGPDLRYRFVNRAFTQWYGTPEGSILGRTIAEIVGPEGFEIRPSQLEAALSGEPVRFEACARQSDGTIRSAEVSYVPDLAAGEVRGLAVLVTDLTQRTLAEQARLESDERLRLAAQAAGFGTCSVDLVTGEHSWSPEAKAILGLPQDEPVTTEAVLARCYPDDLEAVSAAIQASFSPSGSGEFQVEHRLLPSAGPERWVLVKGRTFFAEEDGRRRPVRAAGVLMDITERKRLEQELQRRIAELNEADRRKDEFVATLAHELRNPLAPIRTAAEVVRRLDDARPAVRSCAEIVHRQVLHLTRLVDDLLDLSRINRGHIELKRETVELAAALGDAREATRALFDEQGHELTIELPDEPVRLDADRVRLAQILTNLLSNAAKYTPRGGRISVTARRSEGVVAVSVRDTGVGVSPEELASIFEPFHRASSNVANPRGGLGIGLSIVRRLAQLHGGSIEARSDGPGKGSEFILRLPELRIDRSDGAASREQAQGGGGALRVLLADDNRDAAESLAMLLQLAGHEVEVAFDGDEAVRAAATFRPHIALLDVGMPKLAGDLAARLIREQSAGRDVFLVALTGWSPRELGKRADATVFDAHLTKPVSFESVQQLVSDVLRH